MINHSFGVTAFADTTSLNSFVPTGTQSKFAYVLSDSTLWFWDISNVLWKKVAKFEDLTGGLNTTNVTLAITGRFEKTATLTDSDGNTVSATFTDLLEFDPPNFNFLADDALLTNDVFIPGTEVGASQDYAILPRITPDKRNGILYQTFRVSAGHITDAGYKIIIRKSVDGGKTWTGCDGTGTHTQYVPSIGTDRADPYFIAVSPYTGRFFMFMWTITSGGSFSSNKFVYSDDGGVTFSAPATYAGGDLRGTPYGTEFCIGESGELLFIHKKNDGSNFHYVILESFDDGLTWSERSTALTSSTNAFAEPVMKQGKGGTLVVVSRMIVNNLSGINQPIIFMSKDYGRNWADLTETLSIDDIENSRYNSGYLELEGAGVALGTITNFHNCLPDLHIVEKDNKEFLVIPYYVRYQGGYINSFRITVVGMEDWVSQGQAAIVPTLPVEFFTGTSPAINAADGNGNIFLHPSSLHAIFSTADNQGTSSAGPAYVILGRLEDTLVKSLISIYEKGFYPGEVGQGTYLPSGSIVQYAGAAAPAGWSLCDGSAVSRSTYANLFSIIGTSYGVGDGSTTFNLPDLQGRVAVGAGAGAGLTSRALAATGGAETVTLAESEIPAHTHTNTGNFNLGAGSGGTTLGAGNSIAASSSSNIFVAADPTDLATLRANSVEVEIDEAGGDGAHENMPPFLAVNYIIKF